MKKRIMLILLLVLLAGFGPVFAAINPAQPPGELAPEVMAEYGAKDGVVTQATDMVPVLSVTKQDSLLTVAVHDNYNLSALSGSVSISLDTGQACTVKDADYYLRL
jgi:hypothetical protein